MSQVIVGSLRLAESSSMEQLAVAIARTFRQKLRIWNILSDFGPLPDLCTAGQGRLAALDLIRVRCHSKAQHDRRAMKMAHQRHFTSPIVFAFLFHLLLHEREHVSNTMRSAAHYCSTVKGCLC
jgi:hypothetical protein